MDSKQEKFMMLYSPLAGKLSAFCFAKTHDREEAKELVSETILASYENFHTLKNEKAFLSFLFTIASNIYKAKNKRNRKFVLTEPELMDTMYGNSLSPEIEYDIKILYEAMDKLTNVQKEALYLFEIMGLSQKEIADIQNTTVINVKLRIHRGKKKLAEFMKETKTQNVFNSKPIQLLQDLKGISNG
ncbi:MAG: RNA polymerase sigma factor [FCB group bacterium]|jgi:RNA polymerase sigma-70 factor (ECF subfamily)